MRIGIDIRYLSHGILGGVHTYVANLVPEILKLASEDEFVLYADDKMPLELVDVPDYAQIRILPWRNALTSVRHDLLLRNQIAEDQLDVVHFPTNYGFGPKATATVITLHDEINVMPLWEIWRGHRKHVRTLAMMSYLHIMSKASVHQATLLLTVSAHARQQIAQYSGYPLERIVPIHHGRSQEFRRVEEPQRIQAIQQKFALDRPFILADALKNPAVLIKAWEKLPDTIRNQHQILFFSRVDNPLPVVGKAVQQGYAKVLTRPTREELITLYSMAYAFAFPSWIEGFGMPILEAMACGAPVLTSNRGAAPEVAGKAALVSDAEDADQWAMRIQQVLTDAALTERLRLAGFQRVAEFSWHNTAQQTLDAYRRAAEYAAARIHSTMPKRVAQRA